MQKQKDQDEFLPDDAVETMEKKERKNSAPRHVAVRKKKMCALRDL